MITVKTFPNMFVPMIKPTLKNANFGPNILVKTKETIMSKINMIDMNRILLAVAQKMKSLIPVYPYLLNKDQFITTIQHS